MMYGSYLSTHNPSKCLCKKFPYVFYDNFLLYRFCRKASVVHNVVTNKGLKRLVELVYHVKKKECKMPCNIDGTTGNLKCLHPQTSLVIIYATRYGYFIMTDKNFKTSKCEMGISPMTMVDCLGITIFGGVSYSQT